MSLAARRLIFYTLFILFIIIAPILVGYTAGYRYHFKQRRIVKIGALSVKTAPSGAGVYLNGKLLNSRSPLLINNLLPGLYALTTQKDGYHSWSKTLAVESERTTFAHRIVLFRQSSPTPYGIQSKDWPSSNLGSMQPQSYQHYMVFYDNKLDKIIVIDNEQRKRIAELFGQNALWREKDTPLLFVYSQNEVWQFSPQDQRVTLITRLQDTIQQVIPLSRMDTILLVIKGEIRALELDTRDRQNSWILASFDEIQNAALSDDGKTLEILGVYEGKEDLWELEL